jgi:hypothetical protein
MSRALRSVVLGLAALTASSSACLVRDAEHCAHRGELRGHAWCAAQQPGFPLCSRCEPSDNGHFGCTDRDAPAICLVSDGEPVAEAGESGPSSGDDGSSSSGEAAACEALGIDPACEALDPATPWCHAGECVACSDGLCQALVEGPGRCAPGGRACVECWPEPGPTELACPPGAPHCGPTLACSTSCSQHEHCGTHRACDLVTGACIETVWWVRATSVHCQPPVDPQYVPTGTLLAPFCSVAQAAAALDPGQAAIVRLDALGPQLEAEPIVIDEGKRVALMAAPEARTPAEAELRAAHTSPMLTVRDGAALYVRGMGLGRQGVTIQPALACEGGRVWLDEAEVHGHGPGVELVGCELHVRRSKIHSNVFDGIWTPPVEAALDTSVVFVEASAITNNGADGIDFEGASLLVSYSTIVANTNRNVRCNQAAVTLRNSILLGPLAGSAGDPEPALACDRSAYADGHNVTNGDLGFDIGGALDSWFVDHRVGDVRVREGSSNPFDGVGRWSLGEPIYDLVGTLRPARGVVVGGEVVTYAGAHEP